MKLFRINLIIAALLVYTAPAFAVNCPAAKVVNIQAQSTSILIRLEGQGWHTLGALINENGNAAPGVNAMYSAVLAAQMAGREIIVRYPDGYDCVADNYNIPALMVRTL